MSNYRILKIGGKFFPQAKEGGCFETMYLPHEFEEGYPTIEAAKEKIEEYRQRYEEEVVWEGD